METFPIEGPEQLELDPTNWPSADPVTGRRFDPYPRPFGRSSVELVVREPDRTEAFRLEFESAVAAHWTGTGSLLVLEADLLDPPGGSRLLEVGVDGEVTTLIETGPVEGALVLNARDGHVMLAYIAEEAGDVLLVMLRTSDRATATTRLGRAELEGLQPAGWEP